MKIKLGSVMVDDQDKALAFYTDVLGFVEKHNIPMGGAKWLTVVSADAPDGSAKAGGGWEGVSQALALLPESND